MTIKEVLLMTDEYVERKLARIAENQRNAVNMTEYEQRLADIENKRHARDIRDYIKSRAYVEE